MVSKYILDQDKIYLQACLKSYRANKKPIFTRQLHCYVTHLAHGGIQLLAPPPAPPARLLPVHCLLRTDQNKNAAMDCPDIRIRVTLPRRRKDGMGLLRFIRLRGARLRFMDLLKIERT